MGGNIGHPIAVNVNFASISEALDVFRPGVRAAPVGDDVFRTHPATPWFSGRSITGPGVGALSFKRGSSYDRSVADRAPVGPRLDQWHINSLRGGGIIHLPNRTL